MPTLQEMRAELERERKLQKNSLPIYEFEVIDKFVNNIIERFENKLIGTGYNKNGPFEPDLLPLKKLTMQGESIRDTMIQVLEAAAHKMNTEKKTTLNEDDLNELAEGDADTLQTIKEFLTAGPITTKNESDNSYSFNNTFEVPANVLVDHFSRNKAFKDDISSGPQF